MNIKKVMVAGGGTLGSQIAWQIAFHGFTVTVYDAFENGLETCKSYHKKYAELFISKRGATKQEIDDTLERLNYTTDLKEAVDDADLLSESIPEIIELKIKFYTDLGKIAPEKTIFTTNTSSTIPGLYAEASGRPGKLLALHFANGIWDANVSEVMGHKGTDTEVFDQVIEFSRDIGMVPIPIQKEHPGYVMNSIAIPFIIAGIDLAMNEVAIPEYIDKTWIIATNSTMGPCMLMDAVGLSTVYHVLDGLASTLKDPIQRKRADWLKENFTDKGKTGRYSGEGFYTYPNPRFEEPDFLK